MPKTPKITNEINSSLLGRPLMAGFGDNHHQVLGLNQANIIDMNNFDTASGIGGMQGMVIPVVEFSREGYKIRKIFAQESTYPKVIIEF